MNTKTLKKCNYNHPKIELVPQERLHSHTVEDNSIMCCKSLIHSFI